MNKHPVVAVWGNKGAGKTTLSAALAEYLSKYFSSILLVNADALEPAFAVWGLVPDERLAEKENRKVESIAQTLSCPNLTDEYLRHRIQYLPSNPHIGVMGYLKDDDFEKYTPIVGNDAQTMLHESRKLFQVVLVDCTTPQYDKVTEKALQNADINVILLEPNCMGFGFLRAQASFIRKNFADRRICLFIPAKVGLKSATSEFETMLGVKFERQFVPNTVQARDKLHSHSLFSKYEGEYDAAVEHIAQVIVEEAKK